MPLAPAADFSFQRDIAPYASRFFDTIGSSGLSFRAKQKLQGELLPDVGDIETQRLKLQQERDEGRQRTLQYEAGVSALEEHRAQRARVEKRENELAGVHSLVRGIVASDDPPEVRRQKLAVAALDNAGALALNPDAVQIFKFGHDAIPEVKPRVTDAQAFTAMLQGVSPEALDHFNRTGDPSPVQREVEGVRQQKEARSLLLKDRIADAATQRQTARKMLEHPLKMRKPNEDNGETESLWMEDEGTMAATALVETYGTPEEKTRFAKLKAAPSDHERRVMAQNIQLREKLKTLGTGRPPPSAVTGLPDIE